MFLPEFMTDSEFRMTSDHAWTSAGWPPGSRTRVSSARVRLIARCVIAPRCVAMKIKMPRKLKLTYFSGPGGRAEPARLALTIAGIEFEDERIDFDDWMAK